MLNERKMGNRDEIKENAKLNSFCNCDYCSNTDLITQVMELRQNIAMKKFMSENHRISSVSGSVGNINCESVKQQSKQTFDRKAFIQNLKFKKDI